MKDLLLRSRAVSEPQVRTFQVVIWQTTSTSCTKKRAARAARLFFLIQPIKSLICSVVEAVPVVVFQTPY